MATIVNASRTAIAKSIADSPLYVAWGAGDGAWTSPPPEAPEAVALISEIGRRAVMSAQYVLPDPLGEISLTSGTYTLSESPTRYLYVEAAFDYADASGAVIREVGLFVDSVPVSGLPPGQVYFEPAEIEDPGIMLVLQNYEPIQRSPTTRNSFLFVIDF